MIGTAFQDDAHLLTVAEETNDSCHLTLIRCNSRTSKLIPVPGAEFTTMEAMHLNTISQIYETHFWTNNKAFELGRRLNPNCNRCGNLESMEQMLCECDHYSLPLWARVELVLVGLVRQYLSWASGDCEPIELTKDLVK